MRLFRPWIFPRAASWLADAPRTSIVFIYIRTFWLAWNTTTGICHAIRTMQDQKLTIEECESFIELSKSIRDGS